MIERKFWEYGIGGNLGLSEILIMMMFSYLLFRILF